MKNLLLPILVTSAAVVGTAYHPVDTSQVFVDINPAATIQPVADAPGPFRTHNYKGGSCVHASTITALRLGGWHKKADEWQRKYAHGEYVACDNDKECGFTLLQKLDHEGVPYAYTARGDVRILEQASRTRRPAIITYYPNHSINFMGFAQLATGPTPGRYTVHACLLDNNRPDHYIYVPKEEFIRNWRGYGGDAVVLLLNPMLPSIRP